MTADELAELLEQALAALAGVAGEDWSRRAGTLEWTCRETVDHVIDCVFSYAMQVAARANTGFLPFNQLHALPSATPLDLVAGLSAVGTMLLAVVRDSPLDTVASDGVLTLGLLDWCARAGYEISLHTNDVLTGLERRLSLPTSLARSILDSDALWMLDRTRAPTAADPWTALREGSGRPLDVSGS